MGWRVCDFLIIISRSGRTGNCYYGIPHLAKNERDMGHPLVPFEENSRALGRNVAEPFLHLLVADEACLLEDCAASR